MEEVKPDRYRILVTGEILPEGLALLQAEPDFQVDVRTGLPRAELLKIIPAYHALVTRSETAIDRELLDAGENLKVVARGGVGLDNVDIDYASHKGVAVMNTPGANTIAAVEHTIGILLALCRRIPWAHHSVRSGEWKRKKFLGTQLQGKTLGIIGLGRIGSRVAIRLQAFEMQVIAYDPYVSVDKAEQIGVPLVEFDELLQRSDVLTIHAPLTEETFHMISASEIARMKDGALLVNAARGPIVDPEALYEALTSGKLAGAAMDVFEEEPPKGCKLLQLDNVVATPHIGANTVEAQINVAVQLAEQVIAALKRDEFENSVNMPIASREEYQRLRPFLELAEKIGKLQVQTVPGRVAEVSVEYYGDISKYVKPLTVAVLKGILAPILREKVNYINAPYIADERHIRVRQTRSFEPVDYTNLMRVTITTDQAEQTVAGTLLSRTIPRIVEIDGFGLDVEPSGRFLIVRNYDRPGVIGRVGTILGNAGVNIAEWRLGRLRRDEEALAIVKVDDPVPKTVIEEIERLDDVVRVLPFEL